ncbi:MAG: hypothetical protein WCH05_05555 [Chlorobiaceae bacterium]
MAISYRATSTASGTNSASLSAPTGSVTGDILIAFKIDRATSGTTTAPTGWTRINSASGTSGRGEIFWALYNSSTNAGPWSFTGTTRTQVTAIGHAGVDTTTPLDVTPSIRRNASGTYGTTGITPVTANNVLLAMFGTPIGNYTWSLEATANIAAANWTERVDSAYSTYTEIAISTYTQPTAAATGDSTATPSTAGINIGAIVSLRPSNSYSGTLTDAETATDRVVLKAEQLQDDFSGDLSRWTVDANIAISSQKLNITIPASGTSYYMAQSNMYVDLTGSNTTVELVNAGNQSLASLEVVFYIIQPTGTSDAVYFDINSNTISAWERVAGVNTQVGSGLPYSATNHRYLRIRESAGTTYWDTSPDYTTWTNRWSEVNPIAVTDTKIALQAGTWNPEATGTTVIWDNVNTSGASGYSATFTETVTSAEGVAPSLTGFISNTIPTADAVEADAAVVLVDTQGSSDSVTPSAIYAVLDTVTGTDTYINSSGYSATYTETLSVGDAAIQAVSVTVTDTVTAAPSSESVFSGALETTSVTDTVAISAAASISDGSTAADSLTSSANAGQSDGVTATDVVSAMASRPAQTDACSSSDTMTASGQISLSDATSGIEAVTASVAMTVSDSVTASDTTAGGQTYLELVTAIETLAGSASLTVSETMTLSDTLAPSYTLKDSLTTSDTTAAAGSVTTSETAASTDSASVSVSLRATESSTTTDTYSASQSANLTVSETVSVTDTTAAAGSVTVTDGISTSETLGRAGDVRVSETASVGDAAIGAAACALVEYLAGTDTTLQSAGLSVSDTGSLIDTSTLEITMPTEGVGVADSYTAWFGFAMTVSDGISVSDSLIEEDYFITIGTVTAKNLLTMRCSVSDRIAMRARHTDAVPIKIIIQKRQT